jgi:hypothetical protein
MVFPVYGRGLVLYAMIGSGIHAATITAAAEFLTGACSCEVKSQNPGLELLLTADWDEIQPGGLSDFQSRAIQAEMLLADVRGVPPSGAYAGRETSAASDTSDERRAGRRLRPGSWLAGASLLAALAVWRLTRRGKRSER